MAFLQRGIAYVSFCALATLTMLLSSGCGEAPVSQAATPKAEGGLKGMLGEMVQAYQRAKTYQDAGELFISAESKEGDKQESPGYPFSVAFERPNKLRLHSLDAAIVADGRKLLGMSHSLSGELLALPCPARLSSRLLTSDPLLADAMRGRIDVRLPQLQLLLDDDPLKSLVGDAEARQLPDAEFDGQKCHRVSISGKRGATVLWISPRTQLLVKIEFPSDEFKEENSLAKCSIWAEFKGAKVDEEIPAEAFQIEVPEDIKLLNRLLLPGPDDLSPLLGKPIEKFTFLDANGTPVTRESLAGKVVVLDFWATWCKWCFEGFPNLEKVYQQFKGNDKVVILAVDTDVPTVSDEQVHKSFKDAGLTIPIVRDQQEAAKNIFHVAGLPTMAILGPDGAVQDVHVGFDPNLAQTLPKRLEKILAGESLAQSEIAEYEQARKKYDKELAGALVDREKLFGQESK